MLLFVSKNPRKISFWKFLIIFFGVMNFLKLFKMNFGGAFDAENGIKNKNHTNRVTLRKILHKICENEIFVKFLVKSEVYLRNQFYALIWNNFRLRTFGKNFLNLWCLATISLRQSVINCCKAHSNQPKCASKHDRRTASKIIFTARLYVIAICFRKIT